MSTVYHQPSAPNVADHPAAWDVARYDSQFGFVAALGAGVVDLLDPQPGEHVLDLGCGSGHLTALIAERGATVTAVDGDPAMVAAATARLGQPVQLADGHDFTVAEPVDAVFSNAALHWMTRPAEVLASVRGALRPGGRFVGEMGGARNIAAIVDAVRAALAEHELAEGMRVPWYFPTPAEYATLLERQGFTVDSVEYFARPTELSACSEGLADWVLMFGASLIGHVPEELRATVLTRVGELAEPTLRREGIWYADYRRLRFRAHLEPKESAPL
ncbi:methyltransferase domain-containing protein [Streptomyces sp. XM4193]|uniref:class I SAM-dependent methyltransferase n=1 Tax=Streptomyces sp. XM4193 TaxID=2929782 RepID=UPI001FFAF5D6|nr:methyltransferase domain-containing protein [Streptomyces sp. XM4193]MCK1796882.1 methyltransferase domain-containing protein [Streptomyces sp. XM4193]